jgi:hypothetical protein
MGGVGDEDDEMDEKKSEHEMERFKDKVEEKKSWESATKVKLRGRNREQELVKSVV